MVNYQYSYLIGALIVLAIWTIFFLIKKYTRKEMIIMSLLAVPLGPISELFYFKDYWNPHLIVNIFGFGIEDVIFAFAVGGIASVIYETILVKKEIKTKQKSILAITGLSLLVILVLIFLIYLLGLNSMYASPIAFMICGLIILTQRKDLWKNAIVSGLLLTFLGMLSYLLFLQIFPDFFNNFWQLNNISGIYILGIPIEELIWSFSWGFLAGPFYEFWKGVKEK